MPPDGKQKAYSVKSIHVQFLRVLVEDVLLDKVRCFEQF